MGVNVYQKSKQRELAEKTATPDASIACCRMLPSEAEITDPSRCRQYKYPRSQRASIRVIQ